MKSIFKNLFTLLLFFTLVVAEISCKKDSDTNSQSDGTITLNIDGTAWEASLAVQASYSNNLLVIGGSDGDSHQVMLTIMNPATGETYDFGGLGNTNYIGQWTAGTEQTETYSSFAFQSKSGEVSISKLTDSTVEGTFFFQSKNINGDIVTISDGQFSVSF